MLPRQRENKLFKSFSDIKLQTRLRTNQNQSFIKDHSFPHVQYASYIEHIEQSLNSDDISVRNVDVVLLVYDNCLVVKLNLKT